MSVSKLKNLAIVVLVLINAFFLVIIFADNYADARDERQALESVCEILNSNGISISPDSIKKTASITTMRSSRDVELEAVIAYTFLGAVDMTDQGVIYLYENPDNGSAEFFSAGDFIIRLHEGVIDYSINAVTTVTELLRSMQFDKLTFDIEYEEESETVKVVSIYDGVKILNCTIDFVFSGNNLRTVTGRYVSGIETIEYGAEISNVSTALLSFLSAVSKGEFTCNEIISVESGYQHSVVGSFGDGIITPVWMITANNGRYIVDSATGEIRLI